MKNAIARKIGRQLASAVAVGSPIALVVAIGCVPQPTTTNPTAVPTTAATTPAATTAPSPTPTAYTGPPYVPASHKYYVQAYESCTVCHGDRTSKPFQPFPADHVGRTTATCLSCHPKATDQDPPVNKLTVAKVTSAPTIDGDGADSAWGSATALDVTVNGGERGVRAGKTTVTMKAVHDGTYIYFLVKYADPTESMERSPWLKNSDGTWTKVSALPDKYEDKFAMLWNNPAKETANFKTQGCAVTCHGQTNAWNRPVKYTNGTDEIIDMWHAKTVRGLLVPGVNQVDDQYVFMPSDLNATGSFKNGGRSSDPKTGGGYFDNPASASMPAWMPASAPLTAPPFFMTATQSFDDSQFSAGNKVAGILVTKFQGDMGDIDGNGKYANGAWTIEMKRKLVTGTSEKDVQFSDLTKTYHMGVAVFENAQIGHAVQFGVNEVTFQQ